MKTLITQIASCILVGILLVACDVNLGNGDVDKKIQDGPKGTVVGQWVASKVSDTRGPLTISCLDGSIAINREPDGLGGFIVSVKERAFNCADGNYTARWNEVAFVEKDGKLYDQGLSVGEITSTSMQFLVRRNGLDWQFILAPSGSGYTYTESVTNGSTTTATLKKLE